MAVRHACFYCSPAWLPVSCRKSLCRHDLRLVPCPRVPTLRSSLVPTLRVGTPLSAALRPAEAACPPRNANRPVHPPGTGRSVRFPRWSSAFRRQFRPSGSSSTSASLARCSCQSGRTGLRPNGRQRRASRRPSPRRRRLRHRRSSRPWPRRSPRPRARN